MFVKPITGRQVPDPDRGGYLPEKGRKVQPTTYWIRRLRDGDVVEVIAKPKPTKESRKS